MLFHRPPSTSTTDRHLRLPTFCSVPTYSPTRDTPLAQLVAAIVLSAALMLAYRGIELNGFHFDDWPNILNNASVQMTQFSLGGLLDAAGGAYLARRPVASISFALDWWRGGGTPAAFLVTNLVLHVLTAWAVLALLLRALTTAGERAATPAIVVAAGAATLWWALQPIHVQAVSYAVQRMTELAALFSLLCVWAWLRARRARGAAALPWATLSLASFVLAALSKENAWITPALVLMAEFLVLRNRQLLLRCAADRLLLALPAVTLVAILADIVLDGPLSRWALYGYAGRDFTLAERLLTQPKVVLFHLSQILWPMPGRFSLEHELAIVRSPASWEFWLPMSLILAWCVGALALATRPGSRLVAFFMLWVPVTLAIESSFVPLEMVFEHRMYLPAVGFAGLIAIALAHAPQWPRPRAIPLWILLAAATLTAFWATSQRIPQWRSEISLYENAVRHAPNSVRAWNQLGLEYLKANRHDLALRAINRAIEIEPRWGDGYPFLNRGVVLEAMGQSARARAIYEETVRLFPMQVLGYNNRGLLHLRAGELEPSLLDFDRALAVDPNYAPAWTNRGTAHFLRGDMTSALTDLERAVSLSPRESIAFHYLARIHAASGRATAAAHARERSCRLGVAIDCAP
jgi:tetratricopeptide (TPR) repeat protein